MSNPSAGSLLRAVLRAGHRTVLAVCRPTLQVVLLHASWAGKPAMHWEFSPPTDIVCNLSVKIESYDFLGILKC